MFEIVGGWGSPYSLKVRAVMRYRRIPHIWRQMDKQSSDLLTQVKVPIIPLVVFPDGHLVNDSTLIVRSLEETYPERRSVIPPGAGHSFLSYLLEDFADEWLTKAMYHYRWYRKRDRVQLSRWLAFDRLPGGGREEIELVANEFLKRQVSRMPVVGCTEENAPLIEKTAKSVIDAFEESVTEAPYLFGSRPSSADFAFYGQLSQLAGDPTSSELMRQVAPYTVRWLTQLDDASGVEGSWNTPEVDLVNPLVRNMLKIAGEVYLPYLLANEAASRDGLDSFRADIGGFSYSQQTFRYHLRCLSTLRHLYHQLSDPAKAEIDPLLADCELLFPLQNGGASSFLRDLQ